MPTSDRNPEDFAVELLEFIDPDLEREQWAQIGMALKYEFSDDVAHRLYRSYSQRSNKFSETSFNDTWRSIKPGGFKMGTLVHFAKQGGWRGIVPNMSLEDREKRDFERQKEVQAANEALETSRKEARQKAAYFWSKAKPVEPDHPYLVKKNITNPKGIKEYTSKSGERFLQIPCFNKEGVLMALQSIGSDGYKGFQKGAQVTGGSMSIGKNRQNAEQSVIICEGWATGMSLHNATDLQVVVAFNSANLGNIVRNVREAYPNRYIIVAADNDVENTAGNVGYKKAVTAAESICNQDVMVITPQFTQEEINQFKQQYGNKVPTDYNDMDVLLGSENIKQRVFEQMEANLLDEQNQYQSVSYK